MEGNILIGICSSGIHSNGLSLAHKVFFQDAGLNVDDELQDSPENCWRRVVANQDIRQTDYGTFKSDVTVHGLAYNWWWIQQPQKIESGCRLLY